MSELGTLDLIWSDESGYPIRLRTRLLNGASEGCWVNFTIDQAVDIATQLLLSVRETKARQAGAPLQPYTSLAQTIEGHQLLLGTDTPRRRRRKRPAAGSPAPPG